MEPLFVKSYDYKLFGVYILTVDNENYVFTHVAVHRDDAPELATPRPTVMIPKTDIVLGEGDFENFRASVE